MRPFENEDACIKCSLCVSACPVYRVDQRFLGPKALGPDWYRRFQAGDVTTLANASDCTFCQLCEEACPVGVPVAHLIAEHKRQASESLRLTLRDYLLTHPQWLAMAPSLVRAPKALGIPFGISSSIQWPTPSPRRHAARKPVDRRHGNSRMVGVYVDCFTRGFDSETFDAASAVIESLGFRAVALPRASHCCGAAAYASGLLAEAERTARVTHRSLTRQAHHLEAIVTLNATCDDTLRLEWPKYFGLELSTPVVPFVEFVLDNASPRFFDAIAERAFLGTIYTHATCRTKAARGEGGLFTLIEKASGKPPSILAIDCCGAAGSYAFKSEHTGVAKALGTRARGLLEEPAVILTDSGTCGLHLHELTGVPVIHPARWMQRQLAPEPVSQ